MAFSLENLLTHTDISREVLKHLSVQDMFQVQQLNPNLQDIFRTYTSTLKTLDVNDPAFEALERKEKVELIQCTRLLRKLTLSHKFLCNKIVDMIMNNKHLVEVTDVNLRQLHLCLQKSRDIQQQEDSGGGEILTQLRKLDTYFRYSVFVYTAKRSRDFFALLASSCRRLTSLDINGHGRLFVCSESLRSLGRLALRHVGFDDLFLHPSGFHHLLNADMRSLSVRWCEGDGDVVTAVADGCSRLERFRHVRWTRSSSSDDHEQLTARLASLVRANPMLSSWHVTSERDDTLDCALIRAFVERRARASGSGCCCELREFGAQRHDDFPMLVTAAQAMRPFLTRFGRELRVLHLNVDKIEQSFLDEIGTYCSALEEIDIVSTHEESDEEGTTRDEDDDDESSRDFCAAAICLGNPRLRRMEFDVKRNPSVEFCMTLLQSALALKHLYLVLKWDRPGFEEILRLLEFGFVCKEREEHEENSLVYVKFRRKE